jgi:hypothetical protein
MQEAGFLPLFRFTASTKRDKYHVPADYAQETSLYFFLPGKGFIVHIACSEHIDKYGYRQWWNMHTYLQLDISAMISHEVREICPEHRGNSRFFMDDCEPLEHMLGSVPELLEPLRYTDSNHVVASHDDTYGWAAEYSSRETPLCVEQLVTTIVRLREHFGQFLEPKIAEGFSVFSFTNTYAWPGIDERFWRSFPKGLLLGITTGRIRELPSR